MTYGKALHPYVDDICRALHFKDPVFLGKGGNGIVYRVTDQKDISFALKVTSEIGTSAQVSLAREASLQKAAAKGRAYVPHVEDFNGLQGTGFRYILMEDAGISLVHQRLSVADAIYVGYRLAKTIKRCYDSGIQHGDIKPANVAYKSGRVFLLDFGSARRIGDFSLPTFTPFYTAPEMIPVDSHSLPCDEGDFPSVQEAAERFSFGVTLYSFFAGENPFGPIPQTGNRALRTLQFVRRVVDQDFQPLREAVPDVPFSVASIVDACLHRHPSERPSLDQILETLGETKIGSIN